MARPAVLTAGPAWGILPVVRDGRLGVVMPVVAYSGPVVAPVDLVFLTEAGDFLTTETGDLLLTA